MEYNYFRDPLPRPILPLLIKPQHQRKMFSVNLISYEIHFHCEMASQLIVSLQERGLCRW